jgi:hypothetical protein
LLHRFLSGLFGSGGLALRLIFLALRVFGILAGSLRLRLCLLSSGNSSVGLGLGLLLSRES